MTAGTYHLQTVVKRLYEQAGTGSAPPASSRVFTLANVQLILAIGQACKKVSRFVTDMLFYSDEERKLHPEVTPALLAAGVVSMPELSSHMASAIASGSNRAAAAFCVRLLRTALLDDRFCAPADASELLAALGKLASGSNPPEGLRRLVEDMGRALGPLGPNLLPTGAGAAASAPVAKDSLHPKLMRERDAHRSDADESYASLL